MPPIFIESWSCTPARAIYKLSPRVSLREKFLEIKILTLPSLYIYENVSNISMKNTDKSNKNKLNVLNSPIHKATNSFERHCVRFHN